MKSQRLTLALALALLVSQLMLGVHALDHLIEGEADQCPICCLAAAPALPSVASTPPPPAVSRLSGPEPAPALDPAVRPRRAPTARAPPA